MLIDALLLTGGLALLAFGADRFVLGAAATGRHLGLAPLVVGLTIVAFATSAPELLVSAAAALGGFPAMAVGNALGSNVANIGLVLACAALLRPLRARSNRLRRELLLLLGVTAASALLIYDGQLGRLDGAVLLAGFAALIVWVVQQGRSLPQDDPTVDDLTAELPPLLPIGSAIAWLAVGLAALLAGAQAAVTGAESIAQALGVSDLLIGLTVIAVGTSLPELAVSVAGVLKGEHALAIGNVIGSNLFNLLAVLGLSGVLHPAPLEAAVLVLHFPVMAAFTVVLVLMAYNGGGRRGIPRLAGGALLAAFVIYHGYLIADTF